MIALPRRDVLDVPETMFIRPRRPQDHADFEYILPRMQPLFVYEDGGENWVRWAIPLALAQEIGWADMRCACCGSDAGPAGDTASFHVDTAFDEVDWYLERLR